MSWQLAETHLTSRYVHTRAEAFYAAALREARRREYRTLLIEAARCGDLNERAVLQASAATMHSLIHGTPIPDTRAETHEPRTSTERTP